MDHFEYEDGHLFCEDVDLQELARRVGTPTYVYSSATLTLHYERLVEAFRAVDPMICYSVKSCPNLGVLRTLAGRGAGMDVVSGGELYRARLAGVPGKKIVYAGVGKTDEEIADALGVPSYDVPGGMVPEPIGLFNIESEAEFQNLSTIAAGLGVRSHAALRINPDVDPATHRYTTTGKAETKFGVDLARAKSFFRSFDGHPYLKLSGLHMHLGSPVATTRPYVEALTKTIALIEELEAIGHRIETLDIGGGFGADYETGQSLSAEEYANAIVPVLKPFLEKRWMENGRRVQIVLEPGRMISANAGVLLTRVQYVKTSGSKKFIVCDAGMHTLLRPALYGGEKGAFHFIWPASVAPQHEPGRREKTPDMPGLEACDVVGPICETGDFLALDRALPPVARGDLLAIFAAGAYGMSMSSRYNSHGLACEVLVDGERARVVRRREVYADLVEHELGTEDVGM